MQAIKVGTIITPHVHTLSADDTLKDALEIMARHEISSLVIVDEINAPKGIFTEYDALKCIANQTPQTHALSLVMSDNIHITTLNEEIHDAYMLMTSHGCRHLVVVDAQGILAGVVSEGDILRHMKLDNFTKHIVAKEVMYKNLLTVDCQDSIEWVASQIHARHIHYAMVTDQEGMAGTISERDIMLYIGKGGDTLAPVSTCWRTHDPRISEATPLHEAAAIMESHGIHQLLIEDQAQQIVGLLGRNTLLQALHGDYFDYLINLLDEKSNTISKVQAHQDLIEQSEAKFRALFELLPYGVIMIDTAHGLPVEFNAIAHTQLGYTDREFAQLKITDYEALEDAHAHQKHMKKIHDQGYDLFETKHRRKDGSIMDAHVTVRHLTLQEHSYIIAVVRDITIENIQQAKERLQNQRFEEQAAFLRTLVNTIPDLIWLKDTQGIYLACNPMFERFFGAKEAEIIGKTDFDFVNKELAQFFRDHDLLAMQTGGSRHNEEHLTFADGSYKGLFDTIKTPMKNADGEVIGILGIARDITARKEKELEIQKLQEVSHVGTWEWDLTNNTFTGSDEVYRIFDIPLGETITYEKLLNIIVKEDRSTFEKGAQAILNGNAPTITYRIHASGAIKWLESTGKVFFDPQKTPYKALGLTRDVTERKLHEEKLEELANTDLLTGLSNRVYLLSYLKKSLERAARNDEMIALLIFDLDRFKDVNDSFGHLAGDELLVLVSKRFSSRLREGDLIARLGGDEFALVLENLAHIEDAGRIAQEIITTLSAEYDLGHSVKVHVGASAGIVVAPDHGKNAQELLQFADAALYRAKNEGRGKFCYYTDTLTLAARKRVECETQLRRAIENDEFEVYYQPQVHLTTGRIIGAEALIRWNDPQRGIVSPAQFIPLAEETGLIGVIGAWVLNQTCRQGKIWQDRGYRLTLAVNVSAHQMRHQDIPKLVDSALKESGFSADHLELELTESALMDREEELVEVLHILRARGIRLAIDDFGTGYSSLSYLKRFPIDVLKIDKSFIDDVPFEEDDMAIVIAIIAMGKALGFQVLAEGTERQEQLDFLKEHGCTMYQGYYKSQPLPALEFEKLLQ